MRSTERDRALRASVAGRVGVNLRRLRRDAGLSRDELARRAEVGHGHISKIENGGLLCRADTLVKLAVALGTTPNDLLTGVDWRPGEDRDGRFEREPSGG